MMRTLSLLASVTVAGAALVTVTACVSPPPAGRADLGLAADPLPQIEHPLVFAPAVPPPVQRRSAAHVVVELEVLEQEGEIADGVQYELWSYNGQVPGPFLRVRQGDTVEVRLRNPQRNRTTHTIDFHAVNGQGGGAEGLMTNPGGHSVIQFAALDPGLYIYHCAAPPIPTHIANGLYGLILVEPPEGLPPVDRELSVMQSEFYTLGETGEPGFQPFSSSKGLREQPDYVVFNGRVGALVGNPQFSARTGESVRLYVGNIGPNLVSSFHVIGEIFDRVYREGSFSNAEHDIQTTLIPAGAASTVEFTTQIAANYILVDHSIIRSFVSRKAR